MTTLSNIEFRKFHHEKAAAKPEKKFYNSLAKGKKNEPNPKGGNELEMAKLTNEELLTLRMNERLIVNLLEKIINLGNDMLAEELRS